MTTEFSVVYPLKRVLGWELYFMSCLHSPFQGGAFRRGCIWFIHIWLCSFEEPCFSAPPQTLQSTLTLWTIPIRWCLLCGCCCWYRANFPCQVWKSYQGWIHMCHKCQTLGRGPDLAHIAIFKSWLELLACSCYTVGVAPILQIPGCFACINRHRACLH